MNHFNPEIFLEIAKRIKIAEELEEFGRLRTSIGRAYYSAFLSTRSRLEMKGQSFGTDSQHKDVRDFLKTIKRDGIANLLKQLFDFRVDADYKLKANINLGLCNKCIMIAEEIIEELETI